MKILFIGDIYGKPGIEYLLEKLPELKKTYQPNLIFVNGENAANGRGMTQSIYKQLMSAGVSLITMGNHTWKNDNLKTFIQDSKIIKPINDGIDLGDGYKILNYNNKKILVINALGSVYMDQPYKQAFSDIEKIIDSVQHDFVIVDFHAEVTSEKIALAHFLDGKADVLVGTHTHVQTNDARLMPKGLLYLTDLGMTGALNGVIGVDKDIIVDRFINGYSKPNAIANGFRQLNGAIITLEPKKNIETIHMEES